MSLFIWSYQTAWTLQVIEKIVQNIFTKTEEIFIWFKNASLNWHNKLKDVFEDSSFVESLSDPCLFISKDMIILVYVDDCIFIQKEDFTIQKFIDLM